MAAALPVEDTMEVQEARSNFMAAFAAAEAGDHKALAPVNNDVQAPQIATAYLADTEDVMKAKQDFEAVFKNVEAGGLMDLQAPAPVAPEVEMVEPMKPVVYSHHMPYYNVYHHNLVHPTTHLTYNALHHPVTYSVSKPVTVAATGHHLTYAGVHHPVSYAATYPYTYPVQYLAPMTQDAVKVEEQ